MSPQPKEIWQAKVLFRQCKDPRPVIVLEPESNGLVTVVYLTGQMDLYKGPTMHFKISGTHPDFQATGLSKECFADGNEIFPVRIEDFIRKRGVLTGQLARQFDRWI